MAAPVLIKKYANRRLYDTARRAFISLHQVAEMVREGQEVLVQDEKTGEDVTAFILTQVIMEEARKKSLLLPVSLLSLLIRSGTTVLGEFFEKYLEQVLKNYLAYKQAMDTQFRSWLELGQDITNLTSQTLAQLPPLPWADLFPPAAAPSKDPKDQDQS